MIQNVRLYKLIEIGFKSIKQLEAPVAYSKTAKQFPNFRDIKEMQSQRQKTAVV